MSCPSDYYQCSVQHVARTSFRMPLPCAIVSLLKTAPRMMLPKRQTKCSKLLTRHQSITQQPPLSFRSTASNAALVAASKTSSTPSPVSELHSRYLRAPMSSLICSPARGMVNFWLRFRISSCAIGSSRRSFFNPTRIMGTPGHLSWASAAHLVLTFSSESGVSTLKPIKMTCAWE